MGSQAENHDGDGHENPFEHIVCIVDHNRHCDATESLQANDAPNQGEVPGAFEHFCEIHVRKPARTTCPKHGGQAFDTAPFLSSDFGRNDM
jgi:hypothetical protein